MNNVPLCENAGSVTNPHRTSRGLGSSGRRHEVASLESTALLQRFRHLATDEVPFAYVFICIAYYADAVSVSRQVEPCIHLHGLDIQGLIGADNSLDELIAISPINFGEWMSRGDFPGVVFHWL
jgi:hypothetical protein